MLTRPMLAEDADESRVRFPVIAQPKIDGVRGCNLDGTLTTRRLKPHGNRHTLVRFSQPCYQGYDGEFATTARTHPDLCRLTTSAIGTHAGEPPMMWHVFDLINDDTISLTYAERYDALQAKVFMECPVDVEIVPSVLIHTPEALLDWDSQWLEMGYEGTILRDPDGKYKQGRSTVREGGLLRIKRFIEEDAIVLELVEGEENGNEAQVNELGRTFRSSHAAGKTPNGMLGAMICRDVKTGKRMTVGAGAMPHRDREMYFGQPELLIGQTIKYKHFPRGVKNLPRFPTFVALRLVGDI